MILEGQTLELNQHTKVMSLSTTKDFCGDRCQHGVPRGLRDRHAGHEDDACATVMDLSSRNVLSWRLSNTLRGDFCVQALGGRLRAAG